MKNTKVAIIGGGLAGLTAAIHLSRKNVPVLLFEKEKFPHHKVCGEYVSKEILPYFEQLKIPVEELSPPEINKLCFSTLNGNALYASLPLGGLGISRFALDNLLYKQAVQNGAEVINTTVKKIDFKNNEFEIQTSENETYKVVLALGAFGKRSNLDKTLNRSFFDKTAPWLAIKSHYKNEAFPKDLVGLHNFKGGYCGLSKTESGAVNVCYLASYKSFKAYKNSEKYKEKVLRRNPFLDEFFAKSASIFEHPLSIAQISFGPKTLVWRHILMLGDAAGLLHPLCGNGMAMAVHSAKLASENILKHIQNGDFSREKMEQEYIKQWKSNFKSRVQTGIWLQKVLLNEHLSELSQSLISKMPFLLPQLIKRTHGKPIV